MLSHTKTEYGNMCIFMEPITDKQEAHLDKYAKKDIFTGYENSVGKKIDVTQIISYGEIDINKKRDKLYIKNLNIVPEKGFRAYSTFDYETGTVRTTGISSRNVLECYDSWNPVQHFMQCHCKINKAPRIIIYKELLSFKHKKHV